MQNYFRTFFIFFLIISSIKFIGCNEETSLKTEPQYILTCNVSDSLNLKVEVTKVAFKNDSLLFVNQRVLSSLFEFEGKKYQLVLTIADTLIGKTTPKTNTYILEKNQGNANLMLLDSAGVDNNNSFASDVKGVIELTKMDDNKWNGTFNFIAKRLNGKDSIIVSDGKIEDNSISCLISGTLTLNFQSNNLLFGRQKSSIIIQRNLTTEYTNDNITYKLKLAVKDRETSQTSFFIDKGEALVSFEQVGNGINKFERDATGFISLWIMKDYTWIGTFQFEVYNNDKTKKIKVTDGKIK